MAWLFEAKKRFGLTVFDYAVTSNHIHLLLEDPGGDAIPKSMQLIAGRVAQQYNQRKKRKGAFWEDRYHATAIERGEHLMRCMVYIDLNMVRAGVIQNPSEWIYGGYNELQKPRHKCSLIEHERVKNLTGFDSCDSFRNAHEHWVYDALMQGGGLRDSMWTESIAVGSKKFVEWTKEVLGIKAKGRKLVENEKILQLRENAVPYMANFDPKNDDIGGENSYFWKDSLFFSD